MSKIRQKRNYIYGKESYEKKSPNQNLRAQGKFKYIHLQYKKIIFFDKEGGCFHHNPNAHH